MLKSLDDPRTAGLILEEQANALKSILGDASVLKLVRVRPPYIYLFIYETDLATERERQLRTSCAN